MKFRKRGVSPVIATVLLIVIVIVLALIIYLWASAFVREGAVKFDRAVELSCPDVNFEAGIFEENSGDFKLDVINRGNVPIGGFELKEKRDSGATVDVKTELLDATVGTGQSMSIDLGSISLSSGTVIIINPIIFGDAPDGGGKVPFTCKEVGVEVTV